jgi:serine/threonine-protein kinase
MGLKGKLGYMAPEYVRDQGFDARSDVFALGVVAWQALTGKRLFQGANEIVTLNRILGLRARPPSEVRADLPAALDEVVLRALEKSPDTRWQTVRAFADALAECAGDLVASHADVGASVQSLLGESLRRRRSEIDERRSAPPPELPEEYRTASLPRPAPSVSVIAAVAIEPSFRSVQRARVSPAPVFAVVALMLALGIRVTRPGEGAAVALAAKPPAALAPAPAPVPAPLSPAPEARLALDPAVAPAVPRARSTPRRGEIKARPQRATRAAPERERERDRAVAAPNPYGPPPHA